MCPEELRGEFLFDSDVFLSYIKGDELAVHSEKVVKSAVEGVLKIFVSSMLYDDVISALRSKGMVLPNVIEVLAAIASVPHTSLSVTPAVAISALMLYQRHGGSRKLHYFDAFHVATARIHGLPMITSDGYINQRQADLGITAINLRIL